MTNDELVSLESRCKPEIDRIIGRFIHSYGIGHEYKNEAMALFYRCAMKYYKGDDSEVLKTFYRAASNLAKTKGNALTRGKRFITEVSNSEDGEPEDIFSKLDLSREPEVYDKMFIDDVMRYMRGNCDEVAIFLLEQFIEGWELSEIAEDLMNCSIEDLRPSMDKIKTSLADLLGIENNGDRDAHGQAFAF